VVLLIIGLLAFDVLLVTHSRRASAGWL